MRPPLSSRDDAASACGATARGADQGRSDNPLDRRISLNTVAEYLSLAFKVVGGCHQRTGGGKGRPLLLLVEDSQATPQAGIAAFRKLAQVDGVKVMLTLFTNVVTAQIPLAAQLQMPTVAVVETPAVNASAEWVFAHGTRTDFINPLLGAYWKNHGYKRLYTFLGNNATGQALAPSLIATAKAAGVEQQIAYINYGDTDLPRRAPLRAARTSTQMLCSSTPQVRPPTAS